MNKRIALLCYRVARWLAPQLFTPYADSIARMYGALKEATDQYKELDTKARKGLEGELLIRRIHDLNRLHNYAATIALNRKYEEVKVEVMVDKPDSLKIAHVITSGATDPISGAKAIAKAKLFRAVAEGFAKSGEIDKFLYFRDHGNIKTVGIRLYLKHDD